MLCNDTSVNSVTWTRFQRWVGGCLVILTTSLPMRATAEQVDTAATASIPPFAVSKKTETITVKCHRGDETRTIRVEWFEPNASGKHPAIVLLHGVDGAEGENGQTYRNQAVCYAPRAMWYCCLITSTGPAASGYGWRTSRNASVATTISGACKNRETSER